MPERRTAGAWAGAATSPALRGACVAKRFVQDREPAVELVVGCRERRKQADDVAVEAAGEKHEAALARTLEHALRCGGVPLDQLEREHRAEPPYLADDRPPRRD